MDPDANWAEQERIKAAIKAGSADSHDRSRLRDLQGALREWLRGGGFAPKKHKLVTWKPMGGGHYKVTDSEAGKLAKTVVAPLPKPGFELQVEIPPFADSSTGPGYVFRGRHTAWLGRTPDQSVRRGWCWAVH
jgi:hypothetical protein